MSKSKSTGAKGTSRQKRSQETTQTVPVQATRETIESIAVAVILAFLFRAFVAEAFVIPTGSMAPTLMGQHKDVECPECGYWYQAGASIEIDNEPSAQRSLELGDSRTRLVVGTTCPLCRHRQLLDLEGDANKASFSGDRILVSKFIYDFTSPKRWDVIVFKFPLNAKQNFIKRLIGLPGETILIKHGDIYVKAPGAEEFRIARKPDHKLRAMLQLVDDSKYISKSLTQIGWPLRWRPWTADGSDVRGSWTSDDDGHSYRLQESAERDIWLRYHHIVPEFDDWYGIKELAEAGEKLSDPDSFSESLITDFYAYNAFISVDRYNAREYDPKSGLENLPRYIFGNPSLYPHEPVGYHWVGDLAFEGEVEVLSDEGELLLQLTKAGVAYECRIDLETGSATLSMSDNDSEFVADDGVASKTPRANTRLKGRGTYSIRYSNVDAEIRLWVDDKRVEFDGPTTYLSRVDSRPVATFEDRGDLAPVGVGTRGSELHLKRLRVLRDVYYVAVNRGGPLHEYLDAQQPDTVREILSTPAIWEKTTLFDSRATVEHELGEDQFFPMGDNSPQSSDARMWNDHRYFERELLIGRALLIYWPHPWYRPIPYLPNVKRMRLIH